MVFLVPLLVGCSVAAKDTENPPLTWAPPVPEDSPDPTDSGVCAEGLAWFADGDGDGFGDPGAILCAEQQPSGYVANAEDCAPLDAAVFPGAPELCNTVDDDCDGEIPADEYDPDSDGQRGCEGDCAVVDATRWLGAPELCDSVDNNCDGDIPADEVDLDRDGYRVCAADCDDFERWARPAGYERCDGIDNDCDGEIDEACIDCARLVPTDVATIQEAIDGAVSGDVVCVEAGTYLEVLDFHGVELTLIGIQGAADTIVDADLSDTVVRFGTNESAGTVLMGFTLTGGNGYEGGGIAVVEASPTLVDLVIADNYASYGGGIHARGGAPSLSHIVLRANSALIGESDGYYRGEGGGAYLGGSDASFDNVTIEDNTAGDHGAGLHLVESGARFSHLRILGNHTRNQGGTGIFVESGSPEFTNVIVDGNWVNTACDGGGVLVAGGNPAITNVLIVRNVIYGAEVCSTGSGVGVLGGTVTLDNCVVTANESDGGGVGVSGGAASLSWCDVWGNVPENFIGLTDPTGTNGNVSLDPELDGWHLGVASSLRDTGDPMLLDPDGSISDLGAFGGPGADGWDLDGDGFASWWQNPYDPASGLDCDDDDARVYPGAGC